MADVSVYLNIDHQLDVALGGTYDGWAVENLIWIETRLEASWYDDKYLRDPSGPNFIELGVLATGAATPAELLANRDEIWHSGRPRIDLAANVQITGPSGQQEELRSLNLSLSFQEDGPFGSYLRLSGQPDWPAGNLPEGYYPDTLPFGTIFGNREHQLEGITIYFEPDEPMHMDVAYVDKPIGLFDVLTQSRVGTDIVASTETVVDGVDDRYSAPNEHDWTSRTVHYDETFAVSSVQARFDDGRLTQTDYSGGKVSARTEFRIDGAYSRSGTEDNGLSDLDIISRAFAQGSGMYEGFFADHLTDSGYHIGELVDLDYGTPEQVFLFRRTTFQGDDIDERITVLGDGIGRVEDFLSGVKVSATETDLADVYDWRERTRTYEPSLDEPTQVRLSGREIEYNDGRLVQFTYGPSEAGGEIIREVYSTDDGDRYGWQTVVQNFDAAGTRVATTITFDDGVLGQTTYNDGIRASHSILDTQDTRAFESILRTYDEGQLTMQANVMDDGRDIETRYDEAGGKTSQVITDTADSFIWSGQTTLYADGEISSRIRLYDNGMQRTDTFENAERVTVEREDLADAHRWHSILDQYEDGVKVSQIVVLDDDLII